MNPHDETSAEEIQASIDALCLPSPTQWTVNLTRKHLKQGTYRVVNGKRIRELTAMLRAKNEAAKRNKPDFSH
jgi:hypothetical protein